MRSSNLFSFFVALHAACVVWTEVAGMDVKETFPNNTDGDCFKQEDALHAWHICRTIFLLPLEMSFQIKGWMT